MKALPDIKLGAQILRDVLDLSDGHLGNYLGQDVSVFRYGWRAFQQLLADRFSLITCSFACLCLCLWATACKIAIAS